MAQSLLSLFVDLSLRGEKQVFAGLKKLEQQGQTTEDSLGNIADGFSGSAKKAEAASGRIQKTLGALERKAEKVSNQAVSLKMDLKGAGEVAMGLEAIKNRRDSLDRGKITLSTTLKGASAVIGELGTLEGVSSRIDGDKILLTADVDGTEQSKAGLLSLQSVASRIDGDNLRMKVDVDGAPQAIGELAAINSVADKVDGRNVNLQTGSGVSALEALGSAIDGVATRMRSLQQVGAAAVIPGFVAAIGAIPAIVTPALSAVYALGGAIGAGLAGAVTIGGTALGGMVTGLFSYVGAVTSAVSGARSVAEELDKQRLASQGAAIAVTEAKQALNQAKPGTLEYKNAQLALAQATKAQADAQRELTRLQILNTPAAQKFNSVIAAAVVPLTRVQAELGNRVLPSLSRLVELTVNKLPQLTPPLYRMVSGITRVGESFLTATLNSQRFYNILDFISRSGIRGSKIFANLGQILINVLQSVIPAADRLTQKLVALTAQAAKWTGTAEGMRSVTDVVASMERKFYQVLSALGNLTVGFFGLYSAMDQAGLVNQVWGGFLRLTRQFRDLTARGTESRGMVVDFFTASKPVLTALWSLVGSLVNQWFRVANAVMRMRNEAGKLVLPQALKDIQSALPIIGDMLIAAFRNFGPYIGPIIQGIAELLKYYIALNPVLIRITQSFAWLLTKFRGLSDGTKKAIVSIVSLKLAFAIIGPVIAALFSPLTRIVGGLGLLAGRAGKAGIAARVLGVALRFMVGPVGIVITAVAALAAGFLYLNRNSKTVQNAVNAVKNTFNNLKTVIGGLINGNTGTNAFRKAFANLPGPIQTAVKTIVVAWRSLKVAFSQVRAAVMPVLKQIGNGIRTGLVSAFKSLMRQGQQLATWFKANWPQIRTTVMPVLQAIGRAIRTVLVGAFKFALQNGKILVNWFKQNWPLIQRTVVTVMQIIASRVRTGFNLLKSIISTVVKAIVALWKNNWTEIKSILESVWRIIKSVVQTAIKNVLNILKLGMQVITGDWRGAWRTVKTILSDNWENIKTIVREALRILGTVIKTAWNNLKSITLAAWNAIRNYIRDKLQTAKDRAVEILKNLGQAVFDRWESMKRSAKAAFEAIRNFIESRLETTKERATTTLRNLGQAAFDRYEAMKRSAKAAFEAIKDFMVNPIENAYEGIKDWVDKILGVVNTVLKAVGLDEIKLEGNVKSPGGNDSSGRGSRPARVAGFAKGGMAREHRTNRFAKGGLGTSGREPRTHMWNEQQGNEAFIAERRPAKEQLPYLQTAADWHGYAVVPSSPSLMKNFKHDDTTFARGGLAGVPTVSFAIGGETTASGQAMHSAVKEKFGVDGFNRHGSYLSQPGASRSIDWMVTTPGNRAEGSQKTLGDNIAAYVAPPSTRATIWYGQANYGGGWQGYSTGPGMGNSNTLGHYDHVHGEALADSFKGAQGTAPTGGGGGIGGALQNFALDKFNKMWDSTVQPIADKFLKPLKDSDYVMKNAVGAAGQKIPDGIKEWAAGKLGLSGGDGGGPVSGNFSGSQKQVALEFAKNAVGRGMPGRLPVMTALQESGMKNLDYGDRDSLGYFQQRPSQGWGTEAQIRDPAHALGAFLDAAEPYKGQYSNDPTGLGAWAQAVQRSAFPDAYTKHWDSAASLIGDSKYYSEGGMTNGAQNAVIGEAGPELVLPLSSARVMQSAQTALGVSQLHEEVRGMREDMRNLRVNVGDIETPAADKLIVTQEHTAKRVMNGRDGLNATKKHQSSINKVLDLSGGR